MVAVVFWTLLVIQVATYFVLGGLMLHIGQTRLGVAQLMLAVVQAVIYSAGAPV